MFNTKLERWFGIKSPSEEYDFHFVCYEFSRHFHEESRKQRVKINLFLKIAVSIQNHLWFQNVKGLFVLVL